MRALSHAMRFGVRLMNWVSSGVSNMSWWKNRISNLPSRGASIRATRSSKYSFTPSKVKRMRERRTERMGGGASRLPGQGEDEAIGIEAKMSRALSTQKGVVIVTSGEMYPE